MFIALWYNVKVWGKENAVKVVLWSLLALMHSWLQGAAMVYDMKWLKMTVMAATVLAMFFYLHLLACVDVQKALL